MLYEDGRGLPEPACRSCFKPPGAAAFGNVVVVNDRGKGIGKVSVSIEEMSESKLSMTHR